MEEQCHFALSLFDTCSHARHHGAVHCERKRKRYHQERVKLELSLSAQKQLLTGVDTFGELHKLLILSRRIAHELLRAFSVGKLELLQAECAADLVMLSELIILVAKLGQISTLLDGLAVL